MKKRCLLVLLIVLVSLPVFSQADLQKALANSGGAKDFPDAPYLVVFDQTRVRVEESGLSHVDKEVFYKVLTPDGAKTLQSLAFGYDPLSAYVEVKEMKVLSAGGPVENVPLAAVRDYPAPARAIYWGAREIIIPAGRLEPGDGVWVKTYQKGFTYALLGADGSDDRYIPPMKGHFYDIVPFYSTFPIRGKSYRVTMPATKKVRFEMYNGAARHYVRLLGEQAQRRANIYPPFLIRRSTGSLASPGQIGVSGDCRISLATQAAFIYNAREKRRRYGS